MLLLALEQCLHFTVHNAKSVVAARTTAIAAEVVDAMGRLAVTAVAKHLGVDFAPGRRTTKAATAAMNKAAARVPRLQVLKQAGGQAWKVGRAGVAPAVNCGLSVNFRSDAQLETGRVHGVHEHGGQVAHPQLPASPGQRPRPRIRGT